MGSEIVITCPPADKHILSRKPTQTTTDLSMQIIPCSHPTDLLEPAPLTDMSIHMGLETASLSAYWGGDDAYYVCAAGSEGQQDQWFQVAGEASLSPSMTAEELVALSDKMASVLPFSAGRVAFPVGSAGRTVYRIWRTAGAEGRTKIRAVRAARSRRLPA